MELERVFMNYNRITDIHPSTFRNTWKLKHVQLSGININSIHPETFNHNWELEILFLNRNSISYIHPSTIRNNSELYQLEIAENKIFSINPDTFIHNRKLKYLLLQQNNIKEISKSLFCGLQKLNELDFSNNNIEELNPLVFHQTSNLKLLNLAQNIIRSFNFELCFPVNSNSDSSSPTSQLVYLNLSSNRLTTLDVASVKWLNQTTAVIDLTANAWNCVCSVLLEVWRGLKHKLTLHCASPRQLQGKAWDVMEEFCSQVVEDMNKKSNTSSEPVSPRTEPKEESGVNTEKEGPSVVTTILIVTGVLLVCAVGGGLILAKVVKRRRNREETPEYCDVYDLRASYVSIHSYAEIVAGPSHVTDQSYADVGKRASYISVQS
jgi:hypothetical protein